MPNAEHRSRNSRGALRQGSRRQRGGAVAPISNEPALGVPVYGVPIGAPINPGNASGPFQVPFTYGVPTLPDGRPDPAYAPYPNPNPAQVCPRVDSMDRKPLYAFV